MSIERELRKLTRELRVLRRELSITTDAPGMLRRELWVLRRELRLRRELSITTDDRNRLKRELRELKHGAGERGDVRSSEAEERGDVRSSDVQFLGLMLNEGISSQTDAIMGLTDQEKENNYTRRVTFFGLVLVAIGLIVSAWFSYFSFLGAEPEFPSYDIAHNLIFIISMVLFVGMLCVLVAEDYRHYVEEFGGFVNSLKKLRWKAAIAIGVIMSVVFLSVALVVF